MYINIYLFIFNLRQRLVCEALFGANIGEECFAFSGMLQRLLSQYLQLCTSKASTFPRAYLQLCTSKQVRSVFSFPCFTGTQLQILTQKHLPEGFFQLRDLRGKKKNKKTLLQRRAGGWQGLISMQHAACSRMLHAAASACSYLLGECL